ncbi:MAG: tRNA (guanosine(37)-N1)-methyltransferase TrmD [Candidatus Kapabacteria bacterium]|nr:tRNA (guanosine(37)-N1)-methyltransferase TrmD [Candidatus Kapabacteria bacterium]
MSKPLPAPPRETPLLRIDILSVVPQTFASVLDASIVSRARKANLAEINIHNLHDYGLGRYKQVDDTPYGGGAGMVLRPEPIFECVERLQAERKYDEVIFLTPDGQQLTQSLANRLSMAANLILLCGHYKGVDERVRQTLVTQEISIGDYVLTGGELPAMVLTDALVRLLPGAMGDSESALGDSFQTGLLDAPQYTKPAEFRGMNVPEVLQSGDHAKIAAWREAAALERTRQRRPDILDTLDE